MIAESEAKSVVCEAGKRLLRENLVSGTWGNLSLRMDEENMIITPSGKPYESLSSDDMVRVNYRTLSWEGDSKPSSEHKLHAEIYRRSGRLHAVIHTHQPNASTWPQHGGRSRLYWTIWPRLSGPRYELQHMPCLTQEKLSGTLRALSGRKAALMANHGAVCIGRDIGEAFVVCQVLEKACRAFIEAEFLGGAKAIGNVEAWIMHKYYLLKYSKLKDKK